MKKRQHIISQVVLRQFVENLPPGGRQLTQFDLATGRQRRVGTTGTGYVENFVPVDSQATEDLWQTVEGQLRQAITAALNGTALTSPRRLFTEAIQDHLIKLHKDGGLFRPSVQNLFEQVCDRFDTRGVQILTPASASGRRDNGEQALRAC